MSNVSNTFPGWSAVNKRTVRAPLNPMDRATVVSIYPVALDEVKSTMEPGRYRIDAGTYEKPAVKVVTSASWWREIDSQQPLLEIPVASILVADSIVRDYCNGLLGCDMADKMPGLFYVPGEFNAVSIIKDYKNLLDKAKQKQDNWYAELVKIADVAYSRTNGNPVAVNELMKMAASSLGIEDRDWMKAYKAVTLTRCFACGTLKNPQFPVCPACRAIDPSFKGDIKFATVTG